MADNAPLTIPKTMPLARIHFLFVMLGLQYVYVTDPYRDGCLIGVITHRSFSQSFKKNSRLVAANI